MPEGLERKLAETARKKHLTGKRLKAYIYGTMRKIGWEPSQEKKELSNDRLGELKA